ncbi:carboxylesterase/lipase family protein [Aquirufa aurantiipilula]
MKRILQLAAGCLFSLSLLTMHAQGPKNTYGIDVQVKTKNGTVEGELDTRSKIVSFKGIPFAQAPVGDLRWKAPQEPKSWNGVLQAKQFGPKAVQTPIFGDMGFRSNGMSEDCLYLNVWTPKVESGAKLPVLVYFYGGGFMAGDGSEPRYDGESMAKKGVVSVTINYRLNLFGFFSHPELTKESPNKASGNYGYMDMVAALKWVKANIAQFGGDPNHVTIAGESAGSIAVSAQMASPLAKGLFQGAIGESGGWLSNTLAPMSLQDSEKFGADWAKKIGAPSLKELRAMSTYELYQKMVDSKTLSFPGNIDGYFMPKTVREIFEAGEQSQVPLLVGWNSEEMNYRAITKGKAATPEVFKEVVKELYKDKADQILQLYPANSAEEAEQSATDLAGDRFLGFSTWKWFDLHRRHSQQPVYRYYFARPRPDMAQKDVEAALAGGVVKRDPNAPKAPKPKGAVHSAEIEYALGNLSTNLTYAWTPEDYKVSQVMQEYFANFIKNWNPNGGNLANWPAAKIEAKPELMLLDVESKVIRGEKDARYEFLDQDSGKK